MTKPSCNAHKRAYERFTSILDLRGQWSAHIIVKPDNADRLREFLEIVAAIERVSESEWRACCPWQAALFLLAKSFLLADDTISFRNDVLNSLGVSQSGPTLTVFRGQSKPHRGFVPSIKHDHLSDEQRKEAARATEIFCNSLLHAYKASGMAQLDGYDALLAIAQHYDMRTELLDFTTDPSVAVFFANLGNGLAEDSAVYSCPIPRLFDHLRIILPPPFVKRLYLQRGFFLQVETPDANELKDSSSRVIFEADPDYVPNRRSESTTDYELSLLPGDATLFALRDRARVEGAKSFKSTTELMQLVESISSELKLIEFFKDKESQLPEWILSVDEVLGQLAIIRGKKGQVRVAQDVLNRIAMDNLPLLHLMTRLKGASANVMIARDEDSPEGYVERQLAEELAKSVCRAMWMRRQIELSDEQVIELRREELRTFIEVNAYFRFDKSCPQEHGRDVDHWLAAERELCLTR